MKNRLPQWLIVLLCLLAFGLVRLPFEASLRKELSEARMILPLPGQTAIEQMGQSTLMGTLGGLRALVAGYLILESYHHFSNQNWDANKQALLMATFLEPTVESHWVALVWNRGINAPAWLEIHSDLPDFERDLRYKEYTLDAVALGKAGLHQIPDAVDLRLQIAEVYREKMEDYLGAAEMYRQLISLEGAPGYVSRFHGYFLYEGGKKQEAYDHLIGLYWESERNHLPTLVKTLLDLQEDLEIPLPLWIPEEDPDAARLMQQRRRRKQGPPLSGGLVLP